MMTLSLQYDAAVASGAIQNDPFQRQLIPHLQRLANELTSPKHHWFQRKPNVVEGIYLYGPVGGGKTYLMDLFFQSVSIKKKSRFHFHQFMQQVDAELRRLQGRKDPLQTLGSQLAKTTRLLCLDEFLVHDIADAMILAELLRALFANNVVLMVTSNTAPDDLYLGGLQRARFLPAINLIKSHCNVLSLEEKQDYRLGRTPLQQTYLYPLNAATDKAMAQQFEQLAGQSQDNTPLSIQHRSIPVVKSSERVVWFEFAVICNLPRSQLDYLEIAHRFDTILVSNIPRLHSDDTVRAILLMHFIDVMYDNGVRVIFSADAPAEELYKQGVVSQAFQRTISRLQEMQSVDYIKRHPRRLITSF